MFFISHRGNLEGPIHSEENKIDYINDAINQKSVSIFNYASRGTNCNAL